MTASTTPPDSRPPSPPGRSGRVLPNQATFQQRVAAFLVSSTIKIIAATLRYRLHDPTARFAQEATQPAIYAIWHNRLSLSLVIYRRYVQRYRPHRRMAAMASASRDGAFLARIIEHFGVEPVRGSTSRRGPQALRELVTYAEQGFDLAITPDGPRGPRYRLQEGVVALAQLTGLPIVPACYQLSRKIRAKSWDGFLIPLPFGRCDLTIGSPFHIPRDASVDEREDLRKQVEAELLRITID